jgi:hypothetical protein
VTEASARRGAVPTGEALVLVTDLPDIPALKRDDGTYVDLGYRFTLTGGQWIGYIDSHRYLDLNETQLQMLITVGRLKKLPPVPQRPVSSMFAIGLYGLMVLFGIVLLIGRIWVAARRTAGRMPSHASDRGSSGKLQGAEAQMYERAQALAALTTPVPAAAPAGMPGGSAPMFGKRR